MIGSDAQTFMLGLIAAMVAVVTIYLGHQEQRWMLRIGMGFRSFMLVTLAVQWLTDSLGLAHLHSEREIIVLAGLLVSIGLIGIARVWYGLQGRVYQPDGPPHSGVKA